MATAAPVNIPEGFKLHTENTAHILLPSTNEAFLNPVQEFNRDISVASIRVWSEQLNKEKEVQWRKKLERKAKKGEAGRQQKRAKLEEGALESKTGEEAAATITQEIPTNASDKPQDEKPAVDANGSAGVGQPSVSQYQPYKFVILEALSATGLRSIRYAQEIPLVKYVIANDLASSAAEAMRRNVELNGLGPATIPEEQATEQQEVTQPKRKSNARPDLGKVRINEGDACTLMYNHREEKDRVDVVDLDPYGTASPFIDAAVQSVRDRGLLCVTCTDLSVLATNNYPEKCFSNYGGIPLKAEYCHESALRLLLHTISTSASRYGRYIEPLLSLSIDFYVRVFVRVSSGANEVKKAATNTSTFYICSSCQSHYEQPFARMFDKVHEPSGNVNRSLKTHSGPTVSEKCPECESTLHLAGPMWSGRLHDPEFVSDVLSHLDKNQGKYGTATRMKGMLTVAKEELQVPFYFTPGKIASSFHCMCPSLDQVASALLHAGHTVSRSHACAGSLKTTATRADVHDIFRSWVKLNPVKMEKIPDNSPSRKLLSKEPKSEANFKWHPQSVTSSAKVKLVRYQQNPTPNWGPGSRADTATKRKREQDQE